MNKLIFLFLFVSMLVISSKVAFADCGYKQKEKATGQEATEMLEEDEAEAGQAEVVNVEEEKE